MLTLNVKGFLDVLMQKAKLTMDQRQHAFSKLSTVGVEFSTSPLDDRQFAHGHDIENLLARIIHEYRERMESARALLRASFDIKHLEDYETLKATAVFLSTSGVD